MFKMRCRITSSTVWSNYLPTFFTFKIKILSLRDCGAISYIKCIFNINFFAFKKAGW